MPLVLEAELMNVLWYNYRQQQHRPWLVRIPQQAFFGKWSWSPCAALLFREGNLGAPVPDGPSGMMMLLLLLLWMLLGHPLMI